MIWSIFTIDEFKEVSRLYMKTWFVIPVRGGSRGVPRKNMRILNGRPLLAKVINTIAEKESRKQIIVVTDDDELAEIARQYGVNVFIEAKTTGKATLDEVVLNLITTVKEGVFRNEDLILTVQATVPGLKYETIQKAKILLSEGRYNSVITVVDDRHLTWSQTDAGDSYPLYEKRVNRQELTPCFKETGSIIGSSVEKIKEFKTRIVLPVGLIEVEKEESIDIDTPIDWVAAEFLENRKKVIIRADASREIGMGHLYRALAFAQEIALHEVILTTKTDLGAAFFSKYPFNLKVFDSEGEFVKFVVKESPDLLVLDILNTDAAYINSLKGRKSKIVSFEDFGTGAEKVDLLISDLYKNYSKKIQNQFTGINYALISPSFETLDLKIVCKEKIQTVLVIFGGTDPSNLTEKTLKALSLIEKNINIIVVCGRGKKGNSISLSEYGLSGEVYYDVEVMPLVMVKADFAISSCGRTITELLSLGIPTLALAQNEKELMHTHASQSNGVINLGLGSIISESLLAKHIIKIIENYELRKTLHERALEEISSRSNKKIIKEILEKINFYEESKEEIRLFEENRECILI
jgi:spore coat polysaccharide biosynthesis predicted glycosyltransferase SpsG/CMP-N-acetylneuraminic acid synthetase